MSFQSDLSEITRLMEERFGEDIIGDVIWLDKGLTNRSYKVAVKSGVFVVRLPGQGTEELINRKDEYVSNKIACDLKIDSDLLYFDTSTGVKISAYITDALTMSPELLRQKPNIIMAAQLLKKLHECKTDSGVDFNVPEKINDYEAYLKKNGIGFYDDYYTKKQEILKVADMFSKSPDAKAPCHNDPLCENWVYGDNRMYLIDWEYAAMNDPMWDVAVVSIESSMGIDEDQVLLSSYLGNNVTKSDMIRFLANKVLLDFLWSLWGKTRIPVSGMEMEEYAKQRYERMVGNFDTLKRLISV